MNLAILALLGVCSLDCQDLPEHKDIVTIVAHKTSEGDVLEIQMAYFPEIESTACWLTFTPHGAKPRTVWWTLFRGRVKSGVHGDPFGFAVRKSGSQAAIAYSPNPIFLPFEVVDLRKTVDLCKEITRAHEIARQYRSRFGKEWRSHLLLPQGPRRIKVCGEQRTIQISAVESPFGITEEVWKARVPVMQLAMKKGISPDDLWKGTHTELKSDDDGKLKFTMHTNAKIVGISHDDGRWKLTIEVNKYTLTLVREQRPGEEWPCWTLVDIKKPK